MKTAEEIARDAYADAVRTDDSRPLPVVYVAAGIAAGYRAALEEAKATIKRDVWLPEGPEVGQQTITVAETKIDECCDVLDALIERGPK